MPRRQVAGNNGEQRSLALSLGVRDRLPGMPQLFRVTALKELPGYQRELTSLRAYIIRMSRPVGDNPGALEMVGAMRR